MAASPGVRPLLVAPAKADTSFSNRPAPTVPAPTASPVSRKERRLVKCSQGFMISSFWTPPDTKERWLLAIRGPHPRSTPELVMTTQWGYARTLEHGPDQPPQPQSNRKAV